MVKALILVFVSDHFDRADLLDSSTRPRQQRQLPSVQSISHRVADNLGQVIEYIVYRHSPQTLPFIRRSFHWRRVEAPS